MTKQKIRAFLHFLLNISIIFVKSNHLTVRHEFHTQLLVPIGTPIVLLSLRNANVPENDNNFHIPPRGQIIFKRVTQITEQSPSSSSG